MTGFLDGPPPRWFTIAAHRPFLEDLARRMWRELSPLGIDGLADATILLPTRRAARSLAEAFLAVAESRAVILPQIRALGDLDEGEAPFEAGDIALDLPPAISPIRRRFELAGLIVEHQELLERKLDARAALDMADALAGFLDSCQIEETGDPEAVRSLVEGEMARHWQLSAAFLNLALEAWPRRLEDLGVMDVAARSVSLMRLLAERFRDHPPGGVIIAAGSTGSQPAAADLLSAIANAPRGCVVLPGLDKSLADTAWDQVGEQHAQGAIKRLLARAGLARGAVADWDPAAEVEAAGRWRRRVINEALRPPEATADWLAQIEALRAEGATAGIDPIAEGLAGLSVVTARTEEEAATVAALLLREALEAPGRTAALITPDPAMGRRVSARLTRWNITADSSAGQPLADAPAAVLAGLVARFTADPGDPVSLLAIAKHPLTRLGMKKAELRALSRTLERDGLRGPRPGDWEALEARLRDALERATKAPASSERRRAALNDAIGFAVVLRKALAAADSPFAGGVASPAKAARGLTLALESLARPSPGARDHFWAGQGGEALGELLSSLLGESEAMPEVTPFAFAELLDGLMAREAIRPGGPSHPRLKILGVLEARLVRADLLVLAGLEEGVWPASAPIDPFLSRPMRERLGLPPPERRVGLSAHDFAQAACAPEVVLLDTERRAGAPAVASRWLWRLRTLAAGAKIELPARPDILHWARALDAPLPNPPSALRTATRPRPTPPAAARPRELFVTDVERWLRDPYGLYARKVLGLREMQRPDEPVEAMARGTAIHAAFQHFAEAHPLDLPDDADDVFSALLLEALREAGMPQSRMAREQALAVNVAPWVIDFERRRRQGGPRLWVEQQGEIAFDAPGGRFFLKARADRIEDRGDAADVLDIKTGVAPSDRMVRSGVSPQLPLTAAILAEGGFADIQARRPGDLLYVRVSGGRTPGREEARGIGEGPALAADALRKLKRRVILFDDPSTPYPSWVMPQYIGSYGGSCDHLARLWEWHVIGEADE